MSSIHQPKRGLIIGGLVLVLALAAGSARANVYATNLRLNGSTGVVSVPPGQGVTISFILNEPALAGVTVNILAGTNVVRSIVSSFAGRGWNTVDWDGRDNDSHALPAGSYSVSVTAATTGYGSWTHITDENNPLNYVFEGRGIAVNQNPASPYYGRIYVVNAYAGPDPERRGDPVGIYKFNADASEADEGSYSDGGIDWAGLGLVPWKACVGADDFVYISEVAGGGAVYRWDPAISPGGQSYALRADNRAAGASLGGLALSSSGTNSWLWMTSSNAPDFGIRRWKLTPNGTCATNDFGVTVVGVAGPGTNLVDVALDPSGTIYTCQSVGTPGDPAPRVFRFPAYDPSTNGGVPEITAAWAVGSAQNDYGQAMAIAAEPTGTYVAAAFLGINGPFGLEQGNTKILYATNGALVFNLDLDTTIGGQTMHLDTACAWDAVGNVYYIDNWVGHWRAVSPPGPNQATTLAPGTIQVTGSAAPFITSGSFSAQILTIEFTGSASDTADAYTLLSAPAAGGPYNPAAGAHIANTGPGRFRATVATNAPMQFYRVQR